MDCLRAIAFRRNADPSDVKVRLGADIKCPQTLYIFSDPNES